MAEEQAVWPKTLWDRNLQSFPSTRRRNLLLALIVLSTIICYYQQYVGGAVAPAVLAHFEMSFRFYLTVVVIGSIFGACASLLASLGDRFGRANIVVGGLLGASLISAFLIPSAGSKIQYAIFVATLGFFEGAVLVATPALVRDFSPQVRRGAAMGFWTLGPVMASLTVSLVASNTLGWLHPWQDQYHIAGFTGLTMTVIAFLFLRELAPHLRNQKIHSIQERVAIEARARGLEIQSVERPWKQMARVDILVPALGVSLFLLLYFSALSVFVIYFSSVFGYSQARSNGLGNWFWAADALAVVLAGLISDKLGVRKPLMVLGSVVAVIMSVIFASKATQPSTSYMSFIIIISILSASRGFAYAPWMAAFTETIERRNPALVATGLSLWGWVLRIVVAVTFLVLPFIVTSASPIADYGLKAKALQKQYAAQIVTAKVIEPATLKALQEDPTNRTNLVAAITQIVKTEHVTPAVAIADLRALKAMPLADRAFLSAHGREVLAAQKQAPGEWQRWWWICIVGELLFMPTIFLLAGRWRPSSARRDEEEFTQRLEAELTG